MVIWVVLKHWWSGLNVCISMLQKLVSVIWPKASWCNPTLNESMKITFSGSFLTLFVIFSDIWKHIYVGIGNLSIVCNPESNFEFFAFFSGRGGQIWAKLCKKMCVIETTFLDVFDHQESRKDVPLTTFSEAQNGLDLGIFSCRWSKGPPHTFIHENPSSLRSSWTDLSMKNVAF